MAICGGACVHGRLKTTLGLWSRADAGMVALKAQRATRGHGRCERLGSFLVQSSREGHAAFLGFPGRVRRRYSCRDVVVGHQRRSAMVDFNPVPGLLDGFLAPAAARHQGTLARLVGHVAREGKRPCHSALMIGCSSSARKVIVDHQATTSKDSTRFCSPVRPSVTMYSSILGRRSHSLW